MDQLVIVGVLVKMVSKLKGQKKDLVGKDGVKIEGTEKGPGRGRPDCGTTESKG